MYQHEKLFDKSEIEYITPFLKLWMAFNSWYKKKTQYNKDREAINYYKTTGEIKESFLEMLASRAARYSYFQQNVAEFVAIAHNNQHGVSNLKWNSRSEYLHINPPPKEIDDNRHEYISEQNKIYYISKGYKDDFFSDLLDNIYQVRCCLVHGDFDIENTYFVGLVRTSYSVLYPILEQVMEREN